MKIQKRILLILPLILAISGCAKKNNAYNYDYLKSQQVYEVVKLVGDTDGLGTAITDPNLKNAWGIAISSSGGIWISSNHKGLSVIYDRNGNIITQPVAVPSQGSRNGGAPSGVIFNPTTDFLMPADGSVSKLLFAGEDGTISAWGSGDSAVMVASRASDGAVYKGIAMASDGGANFLYLANFKGQKVDVFDGNFHLVTNKPFADPSIPAGFGPFNIMNFNGQLFVTYAKLKPPDNMDDQKGPGNGFVDIFNPDGTLVRRFYSQGVLNSPWGMAIAPVGFGQGDQVFLIANFGDGLINEFNSNGDWIRQLRSDFGGSVHIDGLWAIMFPVNNQPPGDPNQMFFTAGPAGESHGLFGYMIKK